MLFFYKLHVDLCGSNEGRSSATTHKPLFRSLPEHCLFFARPVFRGGQTEQRRKGEMRWWLMVVVLVQRGMSRCVGRGEETPSPPRASRMMGLKSGTFYFNSIINLVVASS